MNDNPTPLDPGRTAILVMDFQPGIVGNLPDPDAVLDRAAAAIGIARKRGATVGYVRVAFTPEDFDGVPETSRMAAAVAAAGERLDAASPLTAVHARVAPHEGDIVVRKTRVGAFSTTDLADQLEARGIDTIVLAGISTSGVVLSTVRDAHDRDYRVLVLADASADPKPGVHEFLTTEIFPRQAEVITVEELRRLLPAPRRRRPGR
ncbi:MAG TPA: cysteine hydrolase [Solirubrobacterales bacterium]